ncbi:Premnaspirodiene oxygenase [Platanthera zijinensis]|uniref:Premnaspirodiene oxygenase n=1 Tax=Platanthera zijinensis TaxID=2320716 RepID=A0AAP0AXK9_9ASPA
MESSVFSSIFPLLLSFVPLILLLVKMLLWLGKNAGGGSGKYNLPPGPWKLPIIGSMHHLIGEHPHRRLSRLAKTYDPLLHLKLGEVDLITISSPELACEVMKTHDLWFASRPQILGGDIIFYHNSDILFAPHGKYWSQLRKICVMNFFSPKQVKSSGFIRKEETSILVEQIRVAAELGEPVNLSKQFLLVANSIVTREAFGKECGHRESFFEAIRVITKLASGFNIADVFPSMGFLGVITGLRRKAVREHIHMDFILNTIIQEHLAKRAQGDGRTAAPTEKDIVDVLLNIKDRGERGELDVPLTMDNVKAVILLAANSCRQCADKRSLMENCARPVVLVGKLWKDGELCKISDGTCRRKTDPNSHGSIKAAKNGTDGEKIYTPVNKGESEYLSDDVSYTGSDKAAVASSGGQAVTLAYLLVAELKAFNTCSGSESGAHRGAHGVD